MLRRFSSKFSRGKNEGANGVSNGVGKPEVARKRSSFMPQRKEKEREKSNQDDDLQANRGDVESAFDKFAQLIHASNRPLPTQSGDGAYLEHAEPTGLMQDLKAIGIKDVSTLMELMKTKVKGELQDDKTMLMEHVIQVCLPDGVAMDSSMLTRLKLVAGLPGTSKTRVDLTNSFLDELWDSLQHPPLSYLGDQFTYRSADGSNNVRCSRWAKVRANETWRTSCILIWERPTRLTHARSLPIP